MAHNYLQVSLDVVRALVGPENAQLLQLNASQCRALKMKLLEAATRIQGFVDSLSPTHRRLYEICCKTALQEFYRVVKDAEAIIHSCCEKNWLQAAIKLANNTEAFVDVIFKLDCCTAVLGNLSQHVTPGEWNLPKYRGGLIAEVDQAGMMGEIERMLRVDAMDDRMNLRRRLGELQNGTEAVDLRQDIILHLLRITDPAAEDEQKTEEGDFLLTIEPKELRKEQCIGRGAFGSVHKINWLGQSFAGKYYYPSNSWYLREMKILADISHPHVVQVFGCTMSDPYCLVMELMDTNLRDHIKCFSTCMSSDREALFELPVAVDMMLQIAEGMEYLHRKGIVHRGLNSTTILVNPVSIPEMADAGYVQAKVADFSLAIASTSCLAENHVPETCSLRECFSELEDVGTTRWMAPEVGNDESSWGNPFKTDVYSFAIICSEILTGMVPFQLTKLRELIKDDMRPVLPAYLPRSLSSLIKRCWDTDARMRPPFSKICAKLRHVKYLVMSADAILTCEKCKQDQWGSMFTKSEVSEKPAVGEIEGRVTELEACSVGESDTPRSMVGKRETNEMATGGEITPGSMFVKLGTPVTLSGGELRIRGSKLETDAMPTIDETLSDIMRVESRPTLFSYSVLKKATKNFHISKKLGEGGFGSVFKGVLTDGTEVAVKQLSVGPKQGNDDIMSRIVAMLSRDANIEIPEIIQNSKPPKLELTELPDVGGWNEASKHQWGSMFTKSEVSEKPEVGEIEGRVTELEACSVGESDTPRSMVGKGETNEMATGGEITPGSMFVKLGTPATLSGGELPTRGSKLETDAMPTIDETRSGGELRTRGSKLETDAMPTIDESRTRGSRIEKLGTHCMPWNIATLGTNFLECQHESGPHISFCWRVAYEDSTLELVFCSAASMSCVVGLGLEFAKVVVSTSTWEVKIIGIGQESWELMWTELSGLDKKHEVGGIFSVKMMAGGLQDDLTNEYLGGIESAQKYGVGLSIANNRAYVQSINVLQERDHCLVLHKIVEYLMLEEVDLAKIGNQCAVSGEAGSSSRGANNSDQVNNDGTWIGQTLSNLQSWFSKGKSKSNGDDDDNRSPSNKEPPKVEDESASKNTCKITVKPGAGGSFYNEAGRQVLEPPVFKPLNGATIDPTLVFVFDKNGSFGKQILVTTTTSFDLGKAAPQRESNSSFGWYHNLLVTSLTNVPRQAVLETTLCKLLMENPKDTKESVKQTDTHSSTSTLEGSIDGQLGIQNTHIGGRSTRTETGGKTSAREAAYENPSSSDMWRGFLYRDLSAPYESSACYDFECSLDSPTLKVLKDPLERKRYMSSGMCGAVRPTFVGAWSIVPDDTTEDAKYAFEAERTLKYIYEVFGEEKEQKFIQKYLVKMFVNHAMTHLCNVKGDQVLKQKESVLKVMGVSARHLE